MREYLRMKKIMLDHYQWIELLRDIGITPAEADRIIWGIEK